MSQSSSPTRPAGLPGRSKTAPPIPPAHTLQYANGLTEFKPTGQSRFSKGHVGFYCQADGASPEFDQWATRHDIPLIEARHTRDGGRMETVRHWDLGERVGFIPLTTGPIAATVAASMRPLANHRLTAEGGIGVVWPKQPTPTPTNPNPKRHKSKLAIRGYLVMPVNGQLQVYTRLMQLSVHSKMTDKLLQALYIHKALCEAADLVWGRPADEPVGCYELLMPLGPGEEEPWTSDGAGTTNVYPLVTTHPMAAELLAAKQLPDEQQADALRLAVKADDLSKLKLNPKVLEYVAKDWPTVRAWALQFCFPVNQSTSLDEEAPPEEE